MYHKSVKAMQNISHVQAKFNSCLSDSNYEMYIWPFHMESTEICSPFAVLWFTSKPSRTLPSAMQNLSCKHLQTEKNELVTLTAAIYCYYSPFGVWLRLFGQHSSCLYIMHYHRPLSNLTSFLYVLYILLRFQYLVRSYKLCLFVGGVPYLFLFKL
jgi:hypothetical protein